MALRWDDPWGGGCNDYNLYLYDSVGQLVRWSDTRQVCPGGPPPVESLSHTSPAGGWHYIEVVRVGGAGPNTLELMTYAHELQYREPRYSLVHPADNRSTGMASVGAVPWCNANVLESFSAQGPTTDNRTKPDLVAHDWVSTDTYGPSNNCANPGAFYGTSAASPHVAGAAALVKYVRPEDTATQIKSYLQNRVVDLGVPGEDNEFGRGRLDLRTPPAPVVATVGPAVGPGRGGTLVVISGSNFGSPSAFSSGAAAFFDNRAATNNGVLDSERMTARTPAHPRTLGDVNDSGRVTSLDALCILRFVAGLPEVAACLAAKLTSAAEVRVTNADNQSGTLWAGFSYQHTDVNGSGTSTSLDALCVLRMVAALPYTAACPPPGGAPPGGSSMAGFESLTGGAPVSVRLQPSAATVAPGGSVTITLEVEVPAGASLGAWIVDLTYHPAVVRATSCTSYSGASCNAAFGASTARVAGSSSNGLAGVQPLGAITFQAVGGPGASTPLQLAVSETTDPEGSDLTPTSTDGSIAVQ